MRQSDVFIRGMSIGNGQPVVGDMCMGSALHADGRPYPHATAEDGKAIDQTSGSSKSEKQALKIVRFQRHLPLTIQFYISCRIAGVPPLQSDFSGLSSALKDDTNEPKKRKETRTKPTKMARKQSTLRTTTSTLLLHTLRTPTSATHSKEASL